MPNSYKLTKGYLETDSLDREEGRNTTLNLSFKTEEMKEEKRGELLYKWELLIRKLLEEGLLTKDTTK